MLRPLISFWFLALVFPLYNLHALVSITRKELGFGFRGEYNRVFNYCQDFIVSGGIELDNRCAFKIGTAMGTLGDKLDIKAFGSGHYIPLTGKALNLNLAYTYNGIPEYQTHSHTILPYISYNGQWLGIALGPAFRFTSFFGESPVYEPLLSFSIYVNFINTKKLTAGIKCANFIDLYIRNSGSYSLSANGMFHLNTRFNTQWSLVGELEFIQSGSISLTAAFYGFACRGGLRYRW